MKTALSRKNLWEALPRPLKSAVGACLGSISPWYLAGSRFRRTVGFLREAQWWSEDKARAHQLGELRRICGIAFHGTSYYRRTFEEAGFHPSHLNDTEALGRLPIIDATTVREHLDEMSTASRRSLRADYTSTGGTGGRPLNFYINSERSQLEYAYLIASWERAGYRLGMPTAVFRGRIVPEERDGMRHEYDPLLRSHFYSNFHMTDDNMRRYLEHVRTIGECFLHAYPSSAASLARFVQRSELDPPSNIRGIIAESENVYSEQRQFIEEIFGCRFFSCYGHTEKLVAAAECEHSHDYHVWPTYGFFELLDDSGRAVTVPGQRGEIVGTGFINSVTPFIRYRTGDFATFVGDRCAGCGRAHPIISEIRGHRIQETLVARGGSRISWTAVNLHDDTFRNVARFQFFQDTPGIATLRIVPATGFGEEDCVRIGKNLDRKLAGQLDLVVELTDTIPLSKAGKAIYVDQRIL